MGSRKASKLRISSISLLDPDDPHWSCEGRCRKDRNTGNGISEGVQKELREYQKKLQKELREYHKKLDKMRGDFLATRRSLEYATTRRRARLSPIRALPMEIIILIFCSYFNSVPAIFFGDQRELHFDSRLTPLSVCRTWRNVALPTPTCWVSLKIVFDIEPTGSLLGFDWKVDEITRRISSLMQHQIISARDSPFDVEVISTENSNDVLKRLQGADKIRHRLVEYWCHMRTYTEVELVIPLWDGTRVTAQASPTLTHLTLFGNIPHVCLSHLQTLEIGNYDMCASDLSSLHPTCPALRHLYIESFQGRWSMLTIILQNFSALQTLALSSINESYYGAGTQTRVTGDCRELGIENAILPDELNDQYPLGELLNLLPNLASLGMVVNSKEAELGLRDLQAKSNIAKVMSQIRTLSLHGRLLGWEQFSELASFVAVTRLELYPLIGMDRFETVVPWNLIFKILSGGNRNAVGQSYLPQLEELYFRDMSLVHKSSEKFFDSILPKDVEFSSNGDLFPLSVLRLTFSHCKLVLSWSFNSRSIDLPDGDKLSLRHAKEFINEHVEYLRMKQRKVK